jgi:hypothetical protein
MAGLAPCISPYFTFSLLLQQGVIVRPLAFRKTREAILWAPYYGVDNTGSRFTTGVWVCLSACAVTGPPESTDLGGICASWLRYAVAACGGLKPAIAGDVSTVAACDGGCGN